MTEPWRPIATAPLDGSPVRIKGLTFIAEDEYEADAVWTRRRCPKHACDGWFPPSDQHDGMGPYEDVTHWRPLTGGAASA